MEIPQGIRFHHEPLDTSKRQIRLLKLFPSLDEQSHIRCEIQIVDLNDEPDYRAISYEWGSEALVHQIRVGDGFLNIHDNLWQFLDMFRSQTENDSLIWIDQISINQNNHLERNHQVGLMSEIYSNAIRVIAWLGPTDCQGLTVRAALAKHEQCASVCRRFMCEERCPERDLCILCRTRWNSKERHLEESSSVISTRNSYDIARRSYWERLWITQEIILAKDVLFYFGEEQLSRKDLLNYCDLLSHYREWRPQREIMKILLSKDQSYIPGQLTLTEVFSFFRPAALKCVDPRDLIFGLLGIARPSQRISVDYDWSRQETYANLLSTIMSDSQLAKRPLIIENPDLRNNLVALSQRLGQPPRWTTWLLLNSGNTSHDLPRMVDCDQCLRTLIAYGFVVARWSPPDLARLIVIVLESTYSPTSRPIPRFWNYVRAAVNADEVQELILILNTSTRDRLELLSAELRPWTLWSEKVQSSWKDLGEAPEVSDGLGLIEYDPDFWDLGDD